jgi:tetratricopeptide (TPR) repeat protein
MAMRYRVTGESLVRSGEHAQAEAAFNDSLALYRSEASEINIASVLSQLGDLLVMTGRLDEGAKVLAEALDLAVRHELWDVEAEIRVALGRRLAAVGSTDDAHAEWQHALAIYERNGAAAADGVRKLLGQ